MQQTHLRILLVILALLCVVIPAGLVIVSEHHRDSSDSGSSILRALRLKSLLLALIYCLLPAMAATCVNGEVNDTPIVVFRIDDGLSSWATRFNGLGGMSGLEYGKLKHIPITWAIISQYTTDAQNIVDNHLSKPLNYLTWSQFQDYLDTAGGEAASHSVIHSSMPTEQDYINEVINSKTQINSHLQGHPCVTFLQPGTWTGDAYLDSFSKLTQPIAQAIQNAYSQSMAYLGGTWRFGSPYYQYGVQGSDSIDAQSRVYIPAMQATLDIVANTPGIVYIVCGHGVQEQGQTVDYRIQADVLKAFMDKLADLRDQGKIRILSLNDAYHNQFSPNLNLVPDPGFEMCNPGMMNPNGPWTQRGSVQFYTGAGVDNSRCVALTDGSSIIQSSPLLLPPGRYEINWSQKLLPGSKDYTPGLYPSIATFGPPGFSNKCNPLDYQIYPTINTDTWERMKAYFYVPYGLTNTQIGFQPSSKSGYLIDNVSIVSAPVDPAISASNTTATAQPNQCTISWHTPDDPTITSIKICSGSRSNPVTPTSGTLLANIPAVRNTTQQIVVPINWDLQRGLAYFSVFATKADGSYAIPDITDVLVDHTPPATPTINVAAGMNGTVYAQWSTSDSESGVNGYMYAIGKSAGTADIVHWTSTDKTNTAVSTPGSGTYYFSVKAQNQFGIWSTPGYAQVSFPTITTISQVLACPDGAQVNATGCVSAVFSDCFYIEDPSRTRGVKIIGNIFFSEGDTVSISGTLTTIKGERAIRVN